MQIVVLIVTAIVMIIIINKVNKVKRVNLLTELANAGDSAAQYELGRYYFFEAKNIDNAIYWLCLAQMNGGEGGQAATDLLQVMIDHNVPRCYERIQQARERIRGNR